MNTLPPPEPDFFCTDTSLQVGEPMYGTAVHGQTWLLLEYRGAWGARATEENDLPQPAQA